MKLSILLLLVTSTFAQSGPLQYNNGGSFDTSGLIWNAVTGQLTHTVSRASVAGDFPAININIFSNPDANQTPGTKTQGLNVNVTSTGPNETYELNAISTHASNTGTGLTDILVGVDLFANQNTGGGSVLNNYGMVIEKMNDVASSKNVALDIRNQTLGPGDYAILVEGGRSFFGGPLVLGALAGPQLFTGAGMPTTLISSGSEYIDTNTGIHYTQIQGGWAQNARSTDFATVTDGPTVTWNVVNFQNGVIVLDHSTTSRVLNITNLTRGIPYTLEIIQDATGGAEMTLGTGCLWKVANGGNGAINLTQTANARDVLSMIYDGSRCLAELKPNYN